MMELWLVRHGETDFNKQGIVQGRGVNSSLNQKGRNQALKFYNKYQNEKFEKIYTSSLIRTHESVAPFLEAGTEWYQTENLDEISWGIHEGQKSGSTSYRIFRELVSSWKQGAIHSSIENGESPVDVQLRLRKFIELLEQENHKKVLICSHGRSMRVLLCTLLNEPLEEMDKYPHHNLCLYRIQRDAHNYSINVFNDISHLD